MMKKLLFIGMFLAATAPVMAETHAFPVPYVANRDGALISFTELPAEGSIKIYTITGELVATVSLPLGHTDPMPWYVTNSEGKKVATGVYLYFVEGGGQKTSGKIIVIR
jgi:hypothetical protein